MRRSGETGLMTIIAVITTIECKGKALLAVNCQKNKKNEGRCVLFGLSTEVKKEEGLKICGWDFCNKMSISFLGF